ncbi:MAG: AmmeMemoRadiSam system protein B [Bacteroidota bacterium]
MSVPRESTAAGLFYPELKIVLEREIDEFLLRAKSNRINGTVRGLIVPHAGYAYSGAIAAAGYRLLKDVSYDAVVVVGPSHREYFSGISLYPGPSYKTPLGELPIDEELRSALAECNPSIKLSEEGHRHEHSIEVHVPFLQRVLGKTPFVPVVMGDQSSENCRILGQALQSACKGRNILLVASSDLSHYHPYKEATDLDRKVIDVVERFLPEDLLRMLEEEEAEACGGGPMAAVMLASRRLGATSSKALVYCNSGDVTGDRDTVVGYFSAVLIQES